MPSLKKEYETYLNLLKKLDKAYKKLESKQIAIQEYLSEQRELYKTFELLGLAASGIPVKLQDKKTDVKKLKSTIAQTTNPEDTQKLAKELEKLENEIVSLEKDLKQNEQDYKNTAGQISILHDFSMAHLNDKGVSPKNFNAYIDQVEKAMKLRKEWIEQRTVVSGASGVSDEDTRAKASDWFVKNAGPSLAEQVSAAGKQLLDKYCERLYKAYTEAAENQLKRLGDNPKHREKYEDHKYHLSDLEKIGSHAPTHQRASSSASTSDYVPQPATPSHRRSSSATDSSIRKSSHSRQLSAAHTRLSLHPPRSSQTSTPTTEKKEEKTPKTPGSSG